MATSKSTKEKNSKKDSKTKESKESKSKSKELKDSKISKSKKDEEKSKQRGREVSDLSKVAETSAKKRKAEPAETPDKKRKKDKTEKAKEKKKKDVEDSVEADRRRLQGGAADVVNGREKESRKKESKERGKEGKEKAEASLEEKKDAKTSHSKQSKDKRQGPCAAEAEEVQGGSMPSKSRSPIQKKEVDLKKSEDLKDLKDLKPERPVLSSEVLKQSDSAHSDSESSGERRRKRRENAGLKAASGFGLAPPPPAPSDAFASGAVMYGPAGPLVPLPEKVKGLLEHQDSLAQEVMRMKMAVEAATGVPGTKLEKEDPAETTLKMPTRLTDCLMEPDNLAKLLAKTGLLSATLNQEKHLILRAASRKQLQKTLGQLRRVAWACQWGCSSSKVGALLAEKPAKAVNSMVLRLAATSSRLSSHDAKLNPKMRKIRLGTQAGTGMLVLEGIPGLSRKHCTITFEPEKGACYVQDLSTNGTYLNGKRLPRPPFKNPADARVRLFHGDELLFKQRTDDAEELGYVINLVELS